MDWIPDVDFTSIWAWVAMGAGLLGALAARSVWRGQLERFGARRAIETRMAELENQAAGLVKKAEWLARTKGEDADTYESMLHRNYHIHQHFGPVPGCPHCPQKVAAS